MTPTQTALVALVQASNAVQAARDALVACGLSGAAMLLDHAGAHVMTATGKLIVAETERKRAQGGEPVKSTDVTRIAALLSDSYNHARAAREAFDETADEGVYAFALAAEEAAWRAFEEFHLQTFNAPMLKVPAAPHRNMETAVWTTTHGLELKPTDYRPDPEAAS